MNWNLNTDVLGMDYGHGGSDPGASGHGIVEKSANLTTGLSCAAELRIYGVKVNETRTTDKDLSLEERVRLANNAKAKYFISIHHNAGGGDRGEYIHSIYRGQGLALAESIGNEMNSILGQQKKVYQKAGSDNKDYYYVIRNTNMDAVIVEVCFLDNATDVQIADTIEEQKRNGVVIAHGILKHLGITIKGEGSTTTPPSKEIYRVRKSWGDAASQVGAYAELNNAKNACKEGYSIYDSKGNCVYTNNSTPPTQPPTPSKSKVDVFSKVDGYNWVKNRADYAGDKKTSIEKVFIYPSKGEGLFRVSPLNRDYYPWVQNHKSANNIYDFAGDGKNPIDRIQCKLKGLEGYSIRYRAFTAQDGWLSWVTNDSDYAGIRGRAILAIEVEIV